jgi:cytochrome P450
MFRDPEVEQLGNQATLELTALLEELVDDPARRSPDGLLTGLLAVEEDGERLDRSDIVTLALLLLVSGFETTTHLIANGLASLLHRPDQLRRVRDGEVAPETAVEELLRCQGSIQFSQRVPLEDIEVEGHRIPAHRLVAVLIGAANRDPAVFERPDELDVGRDPNPHLAFSVGIHHCLGAALARLEGAIAIPAVLRELPELRLTARPRWRDSFIVRGLRSLPVAWD